jgi:hypothetical protein
MIIINPIINFILKLIKGEAWVRHIEHMKLENTDFTILRFYDFSLCRIFDFPKSSTFTKVVIVARRNSQMNNVYRAETHPVTRQNIGTSSSSDFKSVNALKILFNSI